MRDDWDHRFDHKSLHGIAFWRKGRRPDEERIRADFEGATASFGAGASIGTRLRLPPLPSSSSSADRKGFRPSETVIRLRMLQAITYSSCAVSSRSSTQNAAAPNRARATL